MGTHHNQPTNTLTWARNTLDLYDEPGRVMRFRTWAAVFNCLLTPHYATVRVLWSQKADAEPMADP